MKEKIPKKIHYIWLGGGQKSELIENCIKSWEKFCPDWEIIEWNENNFDTGGHKWIKKAIEEKNWALASDVMRIEILCEYGGVYVDTDMELIKPIDDFLQYDAFFAYENELWFNTCILGSIPHHSVFEMLKDRYSGECEIKFNTNALTVHSVSYVLRHLYNIKLNGKTMFLDNNIALLSRDYFMPQDYMTFKLNLTENSYGIHRYTSTWHNAKQKKGASFASGARKIFGKKIFKFFERCVRDSFLKIIKREYKVIQKEKCYLSTATQNDNIIEVKSLTKAYGDVKAVNNISFEVKRGSFFAFLGQNGAGKSTTINMICSILNKDSGSIMIDGQNIDTNSDAIKRKIGIVFQNSVLDGNLSVRDNLTYRASLYEMTGAYTKQRIEYLSGLLGLQSLLKRTYKTLSGGEKRRIDIARALIHDPEVLFLDEPTTGLDPKTRVMVWEIIEKLRKENNLTIFLTTHYMEEVVRADMVVIINKGEIVASGSPIELKNNFSTDSVRVIMQNTDEFDAILQNENREFNYKNNSYYINVKNSNDAIDFIVSHKAQIEDFEVLKGDMDDVFLNITGQSIEGV